MRSLKLTAVACCLAIAGTLSVTAGEMKDARTMVKLPSDIEKKMLVNMRDHITALDDIVHAIQAEEFEKAESIAESRLGWSSLIRRGDQEVANHWAKPMQKMADQMYRSASNFVIVAQDASVEDSKEGYQKIIAALGEVTSACSGCHEAYRVR
jgi:cytochrome c556